MVEEDLLLHHPIDCPICDKAGECLLQDYHFEHGRGERRADVKPFHSRRRPMGETVMLFVDRCISCTRCVRFCREVSGTSELMLVSRGHRQEIDVFPGYSLANKLSGNVVDLCPVGALGDRKFLYSQRVWFMKTHDAICTGCATGCSIRVDENQDRVYRLRPRQNPHVNQWWMCDEGRYGWDHVHSTQRLTGPQAYRADRGEHQPADWTQLPGELQEGLRRAAGKGRLAALLSPYLTVEEAYLLAEFVRSVDADAWIVPGPAPRVGEDEHFPNGFTISAEKCPNRRGIAEIAAHFMGQETTCDDLLDEIAGGGVAAVWVTGGYKNDWMDESTAERFAPLALLIVQDLFDSPLMQRAHYRLPAAAFVERDGSYVNSNDHLQYAPWSIRPPAGVQTEGRLFWRLCGRPGMYDARSVLSEVAANIAYFSVAMEEIPPTGIDLICTLLAESTQEEGATA
jgi:NADH-quinone oxidoreductase subunit G